MSFSFKKKLVIHLYTICWNEEYMLKYFFKHYDKLVDRYIFYDNSSDDQTISILKKHRKVEIRKFSNLNGIDSYVLAAQELHNQCWKESRGLADWVIITAVDEFLYAPDLKLYLAQCARKKITAIPALGFQMISRTLPSETKDLTELVKTGCPWQIMSKLSIFNPDKIIETNQIPGRHAAQPVGKVKYPEKDELLLLHYKYLSFEHTFNRHADLQKKLGAVDRQRGFGYQYSWGRDEFKKEWDRFEQSSVIDVFAHNYHPSTQHSPVTSRWWRKDEDAHLAKNRMDARSFFQTARDRIRYFPCQIWMQVPESIRAKITKISAVQTILDFLRRVLLEKNE
jgi:hypothetical protein